LSRSLAAVSAMLLPSSGELPSSVSWTNVMSAAAGRLQGRVLPRINRILVSSHVLRSETNHNTALRPVAIAATATERTREVERLQWLPADATVSPRGLPAPDADPTSEQASAHDEPVKPVAMRRAKWHNKFVNNETWQLR
jgi:hypothetical protein